MHSMRLQNFQVIAEEANAEQTHALQIGSTHTITGTRTCMFTVTATTSTPRAQSISAVVSRVCTSPG